MVIKVFDNVSEAVGLFELEIYVLCDAEHVYTSSCDPHICK